MDKKPQNGDRTLSPLSAAVLISGLMFFGVLGLRAAGLLESTELRALDWFFRIQPSSSEADHRIAVIGITESDIREIGRWPLTDATLAEALDRLTGYNCRAVGLDIYRDVPVPPGTARLQAVVSENRNIIAAMKFGDDGVRPPPFLKDTDQVGFNDIVMDRDGTVRRALLFLDDGETVWYSFALRLAMGYLRREGIEPQADATHPDHIRLNTVTVRPFDKDDGGYVNADDRGYQFIVNYQKKTFPVFCLSDLLAGRIDAGFLEDRIVLIGSMAQSVKDLFFIPLNQGFRHAEPTPGVLLHAHITDGLLGFALDGTGPVRSLKTWQENFWILVWACLGGGMGLWLRSAWRFCLGGLGGVVALHAVTYGFFLHHLWLPLVPPALAFFSAAAVVTAFISNLEKRHRFVLMNLFSKHVSPEVAASIWDHRDQFIENGRPRPDELTVTVLFSDLRGYTSVSEKLSPKALVDWLNTYLEAMTRLVMAFGGVVDDYAGDGIKANFGVPLPRTDASAIRRDATDAVNCALAMEEEIRRLNSLWQEQQLPQAGIRIGIHTGPVVAGTIGSSQRMKYTTIGDTVNIAARLESYDKSLEDDGLCRILIGETTLNCLDTCVKTRRVGAIRLKGKDRKVTIYNVLGREAAGDDIVQ